VEINAGRVSRKPEDEAFGRAGRFRGRPQSVTEFAFKPAKYTFDLPAVPEKAFGKTTAHLAAIAAFDLVVFEMAFLDGDDGRGNVQLKHTMDASKIPK
jgi:hypothetical protein